MKKYISSEKLTDKIQDLINSLIEDCDLDCFSNWPEYKFYILGSKNALDAVLAFVSEHEIVAPEILDEDVEFEEDEIEDEETEW